MKPVYSGSAENGGACLFRQPEMGGLPGWGAHPGWLALCLCLTSKDRRAESARPGAAYKGRIGTADGMGPGRATPVLG